ncbi:MAG TPA: hypothetical protein DEP85_08325, partial [Holosporales bacterium]|nr:hypothetical protein [Holosporales bacterium]
SSPLRYLVFLLILVALVAGIWYFFTPARQSYNVKNLALIRADDAPYKVKAEDQSIPGIKHQDKLVYSRIRSDENSPPVEHILPDPEPIPMDGPWGSSPLKMEKPYIPEEDQSEKVVEESDEDASSSIASIEELIEETPEEKPAPPSRSKQQNILIQLGSLKSHDLAQEEWKRLSHKNKDLLGELEPTIQKVDLGAEKGIFYRLRTGVEDQKQAKQICSTLKERKVDCLVVH